MSLSTLPAAETVQRIVGQPNVDTKAAQQSGNEAKGAALAAVLIPILRGDAEADSKRNTERFKIAVSLKDLTPEGHKAFRRELEAEKEALRALAKAAGSAKGRDNTQMDARLHTYGLSEGSFMVYCSHWMVLSRAFEAGMPLTQEKNVACLLKNARFMLAEMHAKGETDEQHNAKGAGRKPKSELEKIETLIGKLEKKQQETLFRHLAAQLGYELDFS